jgi:hypothetical protein
MAYSRRFRKLVLFGGIAFALKVWFVNRMTAYYDRHGRVAETSPTDRRRASARWRVAQLVRP